MKPKILERHEKSINEFVEMLLDKFKDRIAAIVLFGSVAKGTAKRTSDIDLLIIAHDVPKRMLDREEMLADEIMKIIKKHYVRIMPILLEPQELSTRYINPLFYGMLTGYSVLYDPQKLWSNYLLKIKPRILQKKPIYIENEKRWQIAEMI
ncbi:hypothetical protein BEH94_05605 [Candidatus Altiarchaeales archaeon WOR_SM1_SCG]|nr:hypothetical protein BEH94_05605 [Candidatus Altiarchaeales archaeon WOR_SM1_SCG]